MQEKSSHKGLIVCIVLVCAALVGAGIYAFFGGFGNLTVKSPVKYWVQAVNKGDYNKYLKVYPPELRKAYQKTADTEAENEALRGIREDDFKGNDITYKVLGKEKLEGEDLDYLKAVINSETEAMSKEAGIEPENINISEAYDVEVELKYGDETINYIFTEYKIGFRWYLYYAQSEYNFVTE